MDERQHFYISQSLPFAPLYRLPTKLHLNPPLLRGAEAWTQKKHTLQGETWNVFSLSLSLFCSSSSILYAIYTLVNLSTPVSLCVVPPDCWRHTFLIGIWIIHRLDIDIRWKSIFDVCLSLCSSLLSDHEWVCICTSCTSYLDRKYGPNALAIIIEKWFAILKGHFAWILHILTTKIHFFSFSQLEK